MGKRGSSWAASKLAISPWPAWTSEQQPVHMGLCKNQETMQQIFMWWYVTGLQQPYSTQGRSLGVAPRAQVRGLFGCGHRRPVPTLPCSPHSMRPHRLHLPLTAATRTHCSALFLSQPEPHSWRLSVGQTEQSWEQTQTPVLHGFGWVVHGESQDLGGFVKKKKNQI